MIFQFNARKEKLMIKRLFRILCVAMLISLVTTGAYAAENDLFKGIDMVNYDEVVTGNTIKEPDGSVTLSDAGTALLYKNVDFYKDITHMDISYSTQSFFAPRKLELRVDAPDGALVAAFDLKETRAFTHVVTDRIEVTCNLTGVHSLYLVDVNGNAGHVFKIKAYGKWQETDYTNNTDTAFNRKQMLLKSLGAISEVMDDEKLDKYITREDYARTVVKAMMLYPIGGNVYNFVDEADGEIIYLNSLFEKGLVKQTGNYIRPKDCVALADAVEAYMQLTGYGRMLNTNDPTRDTLLKLGTKLGVLKSIITPTNRYMTYRDMVELTFEVLMLDTIDVISYPELKIEFDKEKTILETLHDVQRGKGMITANEYTALSTPNANAEEGSVIINNTSYFAGDSGAESYLGYNVRYYYSTNNDDESTLLFIYDIDKLNEVEFIDSEDIKNFKDSVLTYENSKGKVKSVKIPTTADIIYNGVSDSNCQEDDFKIKEGSITLLDNNSDGRWEVISILSAGVYVVDAVDGKNDIIYPMSGSEFYTDANTLTRVSLNENDVDYGKVYLDGLRVNVAELKSGDVISVYDSKPVDGKVRLRNVRASSMVVNDYVISKDEEGYEFSSNDMVKKAYSCLQNPAMKIYYHVHLTESGKIAWFENDPTSRTYSYGYVTKVNIGEDDDGKRRVSVRMLDEDNQFSTLKTAERCTVDGVKTKDPDVMYTQMLAGETKFRPTVIRYSQNSKGELTMIDTPTISPKEEKNIDLTQVLSADQVEYRNQTDYFWNIAPIDDKTVLFSVPYTQKDTSANDFDVDNYNESEFMTYKNARNFQGINKACEGFDGTHVKPMGVLIKYKNSNDVATEYSSFIYITGVSKVYNKAEALVTLVKGVTGNKMVELMLSESAEAKYGQYIKKGDVWLFNKGPEGDLAWMSLVWAKDGMPQGYKSTYDLSKKATDLGSLFMCYGEEIVDKYKEYVSVKVPTETGSTEYGFTLYNANISVYDWTDKTLSTITPDQIAKDTQTDKEQYVFVYAFSNMVRDFLIINR